MLGLVDYEGSDSEEEGVGQAEEQAGAVTIVSSKKGVNMVPSASPTLNTNIGNPSSTESEDGELVPTGNFLASLPSASKRDFKMGPLVVEDELEDIVKRKDWELKEMKKIEKRRRKLERRRRKELRRAEKRKGKEEKSVETVIKKKVKIEAFGGLSGLDTYSDDEDKVDNVKMSQGSRSKGLLSLLPEPKIENRSKGAAIMLPSSLRLQKKLYDTKNIGSSTSNQPSTSADQVESDVDDDNTDYFGLNSVEAVESEDAPVEAKMADVAYGPPKPMRIEIPSYNEQHIDNGNDIVNEADPSSSGFINDSEAARLIYSHDVAPYGGTVFNAADVANNIVDVNVDQALGPNIRANLLKNLHNKSLAEAAISHLARIPKPKDAKDAVARRKHQITYLATVAVAREEQLAEQWSQNRHAKRMAAQKYGF